MNKGREQLCPLWLSAVIGAGVVAALATAYPRDGEQARSLASQPPSELSTAYLEAWLRLKPDSPQYLNLLATQYIKLGQWGPALRVADRLASLGKDDKARQQALLLKVSATEQMAYEYPPADPRRAEGVARFTKVLEQTSQYQWDIPMMRSFAEKARDAGADAIMTSYYRKLAAADSTHAAQWQEKLGDAALSHQNYNDAAQAYFAAYDAADTIDTKRRYFIEALKVLESGDQVARACDEGARRLGDLAQDPQTLRYLLDLARQVNRSDLVTRYARDLIKLSPLSAVPAAGGREARPYEAAVRYEAGASTIGAMAIPLYRGSVRRASYLPQMTGARSYLAAADAAPGASVQDAKKSAEYELVYKAFVESNSLDDAEKVAQKALDAHLDPLVWTRRLAQVAQWNNHPKVALKYWLLFAQASGNEEAWGNVLKLAPQLDDDKAYLAAWQHVQPEASKTQSDALAGQSALLAQYMKLGHWESALRVVENLKGQGDAKAQQGALLLEAAVTEQLAYQFPPNDARRAEGLARFTKVLKQTTQYQWDVSVMSGLAEKAREAGADSVMMRYYQMLAVADAANASKWQERIGDAALSRQAYGEAARAYFAAQEAAPALDDKRRYFLAALKAFVSDGEVGRACTEAEKRAGSLAEDPETLRYLINLARQASRTDLMARYARDLIKYSTQSQRGAYYSDYADAVGYVNFTPADLDGLIRHADFRPTDRAVAGYFDGQTASAHVQLVATASGTKPESGSAVENSDFDLAFQAFVESKQLGEAEKLAQKALERHLDPLVWTRRLAQVAQWNNHPALALKYWLQFAQDSGNDEAWANVLKLAPQLDNDQAYLAALIHASDRSPRDLALRDKVVATYERLGQPQAGMAYLKSRAKGAARQPSLERYAALAERSGDDKAALQAYRSLMSAYPENLAYATHVATIEYQQGSPADALATLHKVRDKANDRLESAPYWRLYGELARQMENKEDANFAYKHLLATGQSDASDLNSMTYFYEGHPIDAGRTAEMEFRKNESEVALKSALQFYAAAGAWPRIQLLLNSLTPEQRAEFNQSAPLLAARGQYYLQTQRWDAALADYRRAAQLPDADDEIKTAYLWALVDFGKDDELQAALSKWRSAAKVNSAYWGAFAAGELRLGNAARAVTYLRQQRVQSGDDPLWLMSLADAEESSGHASAAWGIRRQAWRILQSKTASGQLVDAAGSSGKAKGGDKLSALDPNERHDLRMARVTLSQTFTNGDISRSLLIDLLKQDGRKPEERAVANSLLADNAGLPKLKDVVAGGGKQSSGPAAGKGNAHRRLISATAKEVAVAWAISGEHNDLARAWLAREYTNRLLRPADAEVTLALADHDRETLARVLDTRQGRIPIDSRIAALVQTGRASEAESVAFAAAEGAPDNSDVHDTMTETLLRDRPSVGADVMNSISDPLRYVQSSVVGGLKLTSRLGLNIEAIQRNQRTTDTDQLAWVPAHDRELNLTLRDSTIDRDLSLTVGHRNAVNSFYTGNIHGDFNRTGPLTTSFTLGINQFTNLSPEMQVGATKDTFQLGLQWNPESRWFAQGTAEANRFHAQDRTYMGHGFDLAASIGYRFRTTYPDWNIRLVGARGIYSASDNVISSLGVLLPDGTVPSAFQFMPQNFTQYGLMVGLGTDDKNAYSRAWRPFVDVGYVHDSNQGWGPQVNLGIGGALFGNDHLRIFYVHEAAAKGSGQRVTQVGLSYRLFY
ncbi:tetratricopeptide repeat protein [Paralcaligenes sp. KSB-10]|uniref:tetratricopeptide repeat protein n=1 Tax=Paralcaligenes sp. KSB-10 TaxID=2901142 RepID=UPI001E29E888|nr:tetratricopeptide repeat protein [Paralcaligenes sp. KSB-10]UHL63655.1 tetratricopeptide repeat protein [Paralcaligenes sp. KSB-10]